MPTMTLIPPKLWAGIDLAKAFFKVAIWGHQELPEMQTRDFPRSPEGAGALLAWLHANADPALPISLVMEATATFGTELAGWILDLEPDLHVAIVNPIQTSHHMSSLALRNKTDDLEARGLAKYGVDRRPAAWEKPSPERMAIQDLLRIRADLVVTRVSMVLRLKDHVRASKAAMKAMTEVIHALNTQIRTLEIEIRNLLDTRVELGHHVRRFSSISGVGPSQPQRFSPNWETSGGLRAAVHSRPSPV